MADTINPPGKRARACHNCHSIKIKCELGRTGGTGPCNRCVRLGRECKILPPKRQKDRVAELEAQVEALTRKLAAHNVRASSTSDAGNGSPSMPQTPSSAASLNPEVPQKKRKLASDLSGSTVASTDVRFPLDHLITREQQQELLDKYQKEYLTALPLVPVGGDTTLTAMRKERPLLLQAVMYAAFPGVIKVELQEELAKIILDNLATAAIGDGPKNFELLQAIQIAALWFRSPKYYTHVSSFELIPIASGMAEELGVGGPFCAANVLATHRAVGVDNELAWRTWLVCRLLSMSLGSLMRKANVLKWSEYDEMSLMMLDYWQESMERTRLLCHIIKAERLCDRIATQFGYYDMDSLQLPDPTDPAYRASRLGLHSAVLDFHTSSLRDSNAAIVTFWKQVTTICFHEGLLHTATNKSSFTAPYIPNRISVSDFPMPPITEDITNSLYAFRDALHGLIDAFLSMGVSLAVTLPVFFFHARFAQAQQLLVRLYVATTAVGNTYGAVLDPESLLIDHYLQRIMNLGDAVSAIDPSCGPARLLSAAPRLHEWYLKYKSTYVGHLELHPQQTLIEWSAVIQDPSYFTLQGEDLDFGLGSLFSEQDIAQFTFGNTYQGSFIPSGP